MAIEAWLALEHGDRVMVAGVNQASLVYNFDFAEVEDLQFAIGRRIGFLSCDSIGVE